MSIFVIPNIKDICSSKISFDAEDVNEDITYLANRLSFSVFSGSLIIFSQSHLSSNSVFICSFLIFNSLPGHNLEKKLSKDFRVSISKSKIRILRKSS